MAAQDDPDGQEIRSERQEPTFYARIPKMVTEDLDPYELTLYVHYKQIASEHGACYKSNANLAAECKMSVSSLKEARAELARRHLIVLEEQHGSPGVSSSPTIVTIRDIWSINHQRYAVSDEDGSLKTTRPPVARKPPLGRTAATPRSPENHKEEPIEEEPKELKESPLRQKRATRTPSETPSEPRPDGDTATFEEWQDYLSRTFRTGKGSGYCINLYNMLKGRSAKHNGHGTEWSEHNVLPAATLDQVKRWVRHEKDQRLQDTNGKSDEFIIRTAETIQSKFLYWRGKHEATVAREERERQELAEYDADLRRRGVLA